eukprot:TRINITY_DN1075_c0_g1_i1.p1 TRINITY_DN1075_c0_g1~~TRINITY_DN1075_c0_g1_i1.p1  ORF type:complete len:280 (+),score=20.61 TRINITY_DN1075_c0_g1_i1:49-888(+)
MQAYANIREPRPRNQPVTVQPPTAKDRNTTASLMAYLREMQLFEPEEESMRRETVLAALNELCVNWCKEVFLSKGYSEDLINEAAPKIFTFGSYRLGVHDPGADIDTLCVFSSQVDRKDFFTSLVAKLMTNPEITNITPVEAAKVPVISMEYLSVPIDLTCARLNLNVMPEDLLLADPKILGLACDSTDILSLNGNLTFLPFSHHLLFRKRILAAANTRLMIIRVQRFLHTYFVFTLKNEKSPTLWTQKERINRDCVTKIRKSDLHSFHTTHNCLLFAN